MLNRIRNIRDRLTAAERRVADWVVDHPNSAINRTLAEIASTVNVSEPTIVRFCRSVGTLGFRDFKTRLAQHMAVAEQFVHADVVAEDDTEQIIAKVIGRSVKELIGIQQRLNVSVFEKVVEALVSADRIDFYGIGASGFVVADAQNKFFRLGIPCNAYQDSPTILQAASITNAQYAAVVVSKTGTSETVVDAAQTAVAQGAQVIAITSPGSALALTATRSLLVDTSENTGIYTPMSSRLAQLAVLDALQVAVALKMGDRGQRSLDKTKQILSALADRQRR